MSKDNGNSFNEWALVELFGHQKIVGKVSEATLAGGAFLRVDVPAVAENKPYTRFYGPGAIYSINPVVEEIAFRGAILGSLNTRFRFGVANTLTGLLFLGIHLPGWFFQGRLLANLEMPIGGALPLVL